MSNYYKFKSIILALILIISSLLLYSCDKTEEKEVAKTKDEAIKTEDKNNNSESVKKEESPVINFGEDLLYEDHSLERVTSKIPYIDHDKFFLRKDEKQSKEGKYANNTSDNKINWRNKDNNKDFANTLKDIKIIEKLTLNGKKAKLPMNFSDFGREYANFDKVDFSKVKKEMYGNHIRSTDSDTKLVLSGSSKVSLFNSKNEFMVNLTVTGDTGKIVKVGSTSGASYTNIPLLDIRFDGIGVGNTLNEMYERLGEPSWHFASGRSVSYFYKDGDDIYSLKISYKPEIYDNNSGRHITVRNNVITNVSIRLIKNYNSSHLGNGVEGNIVNPVVKSANGELLYYKSGIHIDYDYMAPYIDYDEFFIKEEEQPTEGKYSDTTTDGKINWAKGERVINKEPYKIQILMEKLRINDKKVSVPLKFSDLGKEYEIFEKVRLNELTEEMYPFIIKDAKSEARISAGTEALGADFEKNVVLTNDKNHIASLRVNSKTGYISGIVPNTLHLSRVNIRLDGIGIGNTFNEMYERLGSPSIIYDNKAVYRYSDGKFVYSIEFIHPVKLIDYRTKHLALVKKNTIGKVAITVSKNIEK